MAMSMSQQLVEYFCTRVNETVTLDEIKHDMKVEARQMASIYSKVYTLAKKNMIILKDKGIYEILPEIMKAKTKKVNGHASLEKEKPHSLTPAGFLKMERQQQARDSQPLDIGAMMQHIINVDEQNKLYRHALEQIAVILEQAGIIEKV